MTLHEATQTLRILRADLHDDATAYADAGGLDRQAAQCIARAAAIEIVLATVHRRRSHGIVHDFIFGIGVGCVVLALTFVAIAVVRWVGFAL